MIRYRLAGGRVWRFGRWKERMTDWGLFCLRHRQTGYVRRTGVYLRRSSVVTRFSWISTTLNATSKFLSSSPADERCACDASHTNALCGFTVLIMHR